MMDIEWNNPELKQGLRIGGIIGSIIGTLILGIIGNLLTPYARRFFARYFLTIRNQNEQIRKDFENNVMITLSVENGISHRYLRAIIELINATVALVLATGGMLYIFLNPLLTPSGGIAIHTFALILLIIIFLSSALTMLGKAITHDDIATEADRRQRRKLLDDTKSEPPK